ncbi:probable glutamine--tRNA ligase [Harmonia axyridis]|uniref:probable glutamine--tRNA ligase n=1 Tax=Harmonia axyridis TaxID=115357 RepID=UPI001E276189|nr:probable glutamine--tRNA ligase [Harmonia axyridis]
MEAQEDVLKKFIGLGLSESKAKETIKNSNVTNNLLTIIKLVNSDAIPQPNGILLYHLATKMKPQMARHLPILVEYIMQNNLDSTLRVDKAIEYAIGHIDNFSKEDFKNYCGIGVVVTPEQIENAVETLINENKEEIISKRYRFNSGLLMQKVRNSLPWADGKAVKNEIDLQFVTLLGPKTEADLAPPPKQERKVKPKEEKTSKTVEKSKAGDEIKNALSILDVMKKIDFHKPGENFKTDGYVVTANTQKLLEEHLKITGGKVKTRFPPEPNGILHIGHAKAININFGYAKANNGTCYLRYDDTNPEKEEEKFFVGIKDMVTWLGYEPHKITHSSDYFDQLYEWAVELIKKGLAYVCHQTADEMKGFNPEPSPWRNRPIEENLQLFEDMKNGKIDEGTATLRMKITLEEGKLDPVAYRVRFIPHHRTGDKWCIYPTYDFTHCLCDSIENITHSLCTKEFQSRRSSYYWLCNALDIYCPVQWEYGRLNVNYTVVSKRKIAKLIDCGIVKDWDDPRLFTLTALRRRGFPAEAINNFCAQLGVTGAQSTVDPSMLEAYVRDYLNHVAPRQMVVIEPLKIAIENFPHNKPVSIEVPKFPNNPELGSRTAILDRIIYIERTDFMEEGIKGFRRLTKSQCVGLRYAGLVLNVRKIIKDHDGLVSEVICKCIEVKDAPDKPKAFIHWVSNPMEIQVNLFSPLFNHKNPEDPNEVPGGYLSDCNLDSHKIVRGLADVSLKGSKVYDKFQFERVGFFSVDSDTTNEILVLNQTVGLKEDAGK